MGIFDYFIFSIIKISFFVLKCLLEKSQFATKYEQGSQKLLKQKY